MLPSTTAGPLATANVTSKPLVAVAVSVTVFVATCAAISGKSMLCPNSDTSNSCTTSLAAAHRALPAWCAVTVTVPAPVKLKLVPVSVAGPLTV